MMERQKRKLKGVSWADSFQGLMKKVSQWIPTSPAQNLTILSISDQWLKLLHATGGGAARRIDALMAQPIAGMSDEAVLSWLQSTWTLKGFEPSDVLIANPSHLTTVRLFTLPSIDPKEIRDIVELQSEKHTPYAKEEILTDFLVVESDRSGYSRVLVIISHQDVVHRALRLLEGVGWTLDRVGFELEGLAGLFRMTQNDSSDGETLLAELDSETTNLVILRKDKPYYHRSIAMGARQLSNGATEASSKLIGEFQRTLETFEAEGLNFKVSKVVLTGEASLFPQLAISIQQTLDLPTTIVSPLEKCPFTETAKKESETLPAVSFASLVGLAFHPGQIDLTPKALKLHRTFEVRSKALVAVGCQLVAGLLLLSCLVVGKAYKNERYRTWLLQEHGTMAKEVQTMTSFMDQMKVIRDWTDSGDQLLEAVVELCQHTPPTIQWTSITFTKADQISLKGTSQEMPKVFDMVSELQKVSRFSKVEARRTAKKKVGDQDVTEFEISCTLAPPEKSEVVG